MTGQVWSGTIGCWSKPWDENVLISCCKMSARMMKRRGDNKSPYLRPLLIWIQGPGIPFNRTTILAVCMRARMQLIHLLSNPLILRISKRQSHETVSKAFLKSSFRTIVFFFYCLHVWTKSSAYMKLCVMHLDLTKPVWSISIRLCGTSCTLIARTLVMSLTGQFRSEMGL
jgi:hypothetical protein